jgi:hypothetical protein
MKKLMVIVLLVLAIGANAESWLMADWRFELGWFPAQTDSVFSDGTNRFRTSFDSVFGIDFHLFKLISIGGDCITSFMQNPDYFTYFCPLQMTYQFHAGFEPIKGISIIYNHQCIHTIQPYIPINMDSEHDNISLIVKGTLDF